MIRWQPIVGITLGLAAATLIAALFSPHRPAAPTAAPMLPDCGGPIRTVVLQYTPGSQMVLPVFRDFLRQAPPEICVLLACPDEPALTEFRAGVGDIRQPLTPVLTRHPQTAWSRDRFLALPPLNPGEPTTLLSPRLESTPAWPQRQGDAIIADDLAAELPKEVRAARSDLFFDAGDFLADGDYVFLTSAVMLRNIQHTAADRAEVLAKVRRELHLQPVELQGAPDHHVGMYAMSAGNRTMLVGDPSLATPFLADIAPALLEKLPGGADLTPQTQARFDAVARLLESHHFTVVRIPTVLSPTAKIYLTYVNVILDAPRPGHPIPTVYLPQYTGADALNAAAAKVWQSLHYDVRPINCTTAFPHGGTLHCLVNVIDRD